MAILCSLFAQVVIAQTTSIVNISSLGSISHTLNLALIPDDWGDYHIFGKITYASDPQICFLDYNVERSAGRPSIRLERHTSADANDAREVNGRWLPIGPGDHIVAKCWIKTDGTLYTGQYPDYSGGRIGLDICAPKGDGDISIVDSYPHSGQEHIDGIVRWGTTTWTLKTFDFYISATRYTQDIMGNPIPSTYASHIVMWVQAQPSEFQGVAWFADAELYINP